MAAIGILTVAVFSIFLRGFVLTVLWGWFISQPFGIRPISIPIAMGFSILVAMFGNANPPANTSKWEIRLVAVIVSYALALLFGFLWHLGV